MKKLVATAMLASLISASEAVAQVKKDLTVYASFESARNIGFDYGVGGTAEANVQNDIFGVNAKSTLTNEKKAGAETGFTYRAQATGRLYSGNIFVGAGIRASGYRTQFIDGETWAKGYVMPIIGGGVRNETLELEMDFVPKENQTKNKSWQITYDLSIAPDKTHNNFRIRYSGGILSFIQNDGRRVGFYSEVGGGLRF